MPRIVIPFRTCRGLPACRCAASERSFSHRHALSKALRHFDSPTERLPAHSPLFRMSRDRIDAQVTSANNVPSGSAAAEVRRAADANLGEGVITPLQRVVQNVLQQAHAARMRGDWIAARPLYEEAARLDSSGEADAWLCISCITGLGCVKDEQRAHRHATVSAEKGFAFGVNNLGHCLEHGIGCAKDVAQAVQMCVVPFPHRVYVTTCAGTRKRRVRASRWR
jgi:hypothetical protein